MRRPAAQSRGARPEFRALSEAVGGRGMLVARRLQESADMRAVLLRLLSAGL